MDSLKEAAWRQRRSDTAKRLKTAEVAPEDGTYTSLTELDIPQALVDYCTANEQEVFLLHDSGPAAGDRRFLLFGLQRNMDALKQAKVWLTDGTFAVAPSLFKQLYTARAQKIHEKPRSRPT